MSLKAEDIDQLRYDTDGTQKVIHLNNAGAALPPNKVRDAVIDYLREEAELGAYELNRMRCKKLDETYESIAQLINAQPKEIALLENATAAWHAAFHAIEWEADDELICNESDYASNYLSYLHHPARPKVRVIPTTEEGDEDLTAFESMINGHTKLVAITHMPTNSGHLAPAEQIGVICQNKKVLFLLDACQTVGQYPINVKDLRCDMLSATGRKYLRGPRGTGFLYVNKDVLHRLNPMCIDLHSAEWTGPQHYQIRSDARKFENWEGNRANQMGLKTAVDYAMSVGMDLVWDRVQKLASYVRSSIETLEHVDCHDQGSALGGIVSFTVQGYSADKVVNMLHEKGINLSWNGRSNTYLDMTKKQLDEIVRCSVHYYNTTEELDQFIEALKELVE